MTDARARRAHDHRAGPHRMIGALLELILIIANIGTAIVLISSRT